MINNIIEAYQRSHPDKRKKKDESKENSNKKPSNSNELIGARVSRNQNIDHIDVHGDNDDEDEDPEPHSTGSDTSGQSDGSIHIK